jgi:hypothetical protein
MGKGNDRDKRKRAGVGSIGTWVPAAGVAAAAMILAAGCGGSTNAASTGHTTGAGGTATAGSSASSGGGSQAPAAAIQAALTASTNGNDKTVTVSGSFTSASGTGQLSGQEEFSPDFGMSVNLTTAGSTISEVWINDTIYMKAPQFASELSAGKTWFSMDLSNLGAFGSSFSGEIDSLKNTDPSQMLASMLASDNLADVGQQTINGVQTTHYSGTIDPATAWESATAKQYLTPAQIQQLKDLDTAAGASSEKIDMWVAANGLPAQVAIVDTTAAGTTSGQYEFTDWGQPVNITAPPASEVEDMSSMMSGLPTSS